MAPSAGQNPPPPLPSLDTTPPPCAALLSNPPYLSTDGETPERAWAAHWAPLLMTDDMPLMAARARVADILHTLQQGVLMHAHLRRMKVHGIHGALQHMRTADQIQACEGRLERGTKAYQAALQALVDLGQGDWGFPAEWQTLYFDRDAEPIAILWEAATDIISTRYSRPGPLVDQLAEWIPSGPPVTTRPKIKLFRYVPQRVRVYYFSCSALFAASFMQTRKCQRWRKCWRKSIRM